MRKVLAGNCQNENIFNLIDPTQFVEADFEAEVIKALTCLQPDYMCGVFAGSFVLEGERRMADLALIHKSLSHWFVVEVELAGHSLEHHVLPQVRCFRYGEPESSCVTSLVRAFSELQPAEAESLLRYVPRYVAVVGNMPNPDWTAALRAVDVQHLTVSIYHDQSGRPAYEVEGRLTVRIESLGFARYSAIDNCLRIPKGSGLPVGDIQIVDQFGNLGEWTVQENAGVLWIRKARGPALIQHDSYVQLIRSFDGQISIRPSC
ncbi:TauD/TfdA family dioxygenase [Betaproteobacteria bacterium SCN2]|nr:TauD/TfdA family dioxygenase [Betaproteobacteria bacterium SCN2]